FAPAVPRGGCYQEQQRGSIGPPTRESADRNGRRGFPAQEVRLVAAQGFCGEQRRKGQKCRWKALRWHTLERSPTIGNERAGRICDVQRAAEPGPRPLHSARPILAADRRFPKMDNAPDAILEDSGAKVHISGEAANDSAEDAPFHSRQPFVIQAAL